jgi:hypothetical protein
MPVVKTDNAGNILNDNEVSIMSYRFIDNKKLNYLQVYNSPYSIKRTNRYLVRARDGKSPFIVNRDSKSVVLIREEKEINLDKNLSEIFDVSFINEKLCFVGIDQQGKAVQGAYSTIGKTINIIPLNTPIPFPNATISKSTIYSYRKDDEANKLLFESFRIPAR